MKSPQVMLAFMVTCILIIYAAPGAAQHREHLFDQGNQLFQKGEYSKALQKYNEILQMQYESSELYYNMGNCYYKLGQPPRAILFYERALRLNPHDEDIRFNLQVANLSAVDRIQAIPELFYVQYFKQFRSYFSLHSLTLISLLSYFLLTGLISLWLLTRSTGARRILKIFTLIILIVTILSSSLFISKILLARQDIEAIIMSPAVIVRSAPGSDATEIFTIHEGLKVRITSHRGDWSEIRLPDGKEGWLLLSTFEVI